MQPSLQARVARCIDHVRSSTEACALIVGADQLDEARRLVGDEHVIVCEAGPMMARFLKNWESQLLEEYGFKSRRRR
jgi:hypothetical protein